MKRHRPSSSKVIVCPQLRFQGVFVRCFLMVIVAMSVFYAPCSSMVANDVLDNALRAMSKNRDLFSNVQMTWLDEETTSNSKTVRRFEFWSREGEYFRIDSEVLESTNDKKAPVGKKSRLIVRPDRYVSLFAPAGRSFAVVGIGSQEEGKDDLYSNFVFNSSIRGYYGYVTDAFKACEGSQPAYRLITAQNTSNMMKARMDADGKDTKHYVYEYEVNLDRGVCTAWNEEGTSGGQKSSENSVIKQYDKDAIPVHILVQSRNSMGTFRQEINRTNFIDEPAPIGVFSLEGYGITASSSISKWVRRLIILGVGISLVGIYAAYKYRRR